MKLQAFLDKVNKSLARLTETNIPVFDHIFIRLFQGFVGPSHHKSYMNNICTTNIKENILTKEILQNKPLWYD